MVAAFQAGGGSRVLCCRCKAGGLGLNLTPPATSSTTTAGGTRPSRIRPPTGPTASASARRQVHKLVCAGTIEERIDELIEAKRGLATSIVDRGIETAISELSDDELVDLVELRQ